MTARILLLTEPTVVSWLARLDEQGPHALVRPAEPVNKFPQFVGYLVRRLKTLNPELGKRKLAAVLARAGLHLGATTVARMLKARVPAAPQPMKEVAESRGELIAKQPHDVWHVDLTVVSTGGGFCVPWLPFTLPQRLPFGWWVAAVVDGYSRRVLQRGCFAEQPTSAEVHKLLARTIRELGARPRNLICDRGVQFDCRGLRAWCRRRRHAR